MQLPGSKKMLNFYILDILREHSDEEHRLTQRQIIELLKREYDMDCERKAVGRNITALMEYGFDIENDGGYWLVAREFEDSELRLLIDSVYFSRHIPAGQAKALIEKLTGMAGPGFGRGLNHVMGLPALHSVASRQFFYTLQTLDEAIGRGCKVRLMVNRYGADKLLHPRREKPYVVNPYRLVAANGRYYLVGNHNGHNNAAHLRVDRITDCVILEDERAKPMRLVKGLENGPDVPRYMAENIYMTIGESARTRFRIPEEEIGQAIDWFGTDIAITPAAQPGMLTVEVTVNQTAMYHWALQYVDFVEVLEPAALRAQLAGALRGAAERYEAAPER